MSAFDPKRTSALLPFRTAQWSSRVAGMLLSMVMICCNYRDIQWVVVTLMALFSFGKGIGALG
jgi:hypothetical protein